MKKPWTEYVGDFVAGKGFYIVLFLCVAAIGISGYYLFSTLGAGGEDTAVSKPTQVVVTPSPSPSPPASGTEDTPTVKASPTPSATPPAVPSPTPSAKPSATPTPSPSPSPSPSATAQAAYVWPVKGEVIHDFSLEVLAYDETMGDWRTHSGVDIAAQVGDQVFAMAAGTVTEIYTDDLMGTTVVIDHGSGLCSSYSNLAAIPTVDVGDTVSTGSVIGSVGQTALAESDRASHLHLEVFRNGTRVDPSQYLP